VRFSTVVLALGAWATSTWLMIGIVDYRHKHSEYNWAVQGRDAAISGCPGRYPQFAEIDGHRYLIGCWGSR
jgi:hypothetical protein